MCGHEGRDHRGGDDADQTGRQHTPQENGHGIKVVDRLGLRVGREKQFLQIRSLSHEKNVGADAPKDGDEEADHEGHGRPHVLAFDRLGTFHCQSPGHGGGPDRATHQPGGKDHPEHIGCSEATAFHEWVEPGFAVELLNGVHDVRPTQILQADDRGRQDAKGQHHELNVIGHHHGYHATQDGINQHQHQENGHHCGQSAAVLGHTGDAHDEHGTHFEEQPHIQDPTESQHHAAQDTGFAIEAFFVEFRNGQYFHFTQSADDESGDPHDEGDDCGG